MWKRFRNKTHTGGRCTEHAHTLSRLFPLTKNGGRSAPGCCRLTRSSDFESCTQVLKLDLNFMEDTGKIPKLIFIHVIGVTWLEL